MDSDKVVGARIRQARVAAGFERQVDFAKAIDVRAHTLWRYEDGRVTPSSAVLLRIAQKSGVTMEWLLTGEEPPPAESLEATGTEG